MDSSSTFQASVLANLEIPPRLHPRPRAHLRLSFSTLVAPFPNLSTVFPPPRCTCLGRIRPQFSKIGSPTQPPCVYWRSPTYHHTHMPVLARAYHSTTTPVLAWESSTLTCARAPLGHRQPQRSLVPYASLSTEKAVQRRLLSVPKKVAC
eukprot:2713001-Rhodomonas_salina.3